MGKEIKEVRAPEDIYTYMDYVENLNESPEGYQMGDIGFYSYDKNRKEWVAMNHSGGQCILNRFETKEEAISWLKGEDTEYLIRVGGFTPTENVYEDRGKVTFCKRGKETSYLDLLLAAELLILLMEEDEGTMAQFNRFMGLSGEDREDEIADTMDQIQEMEEMEAKSWGIRHGVQ